MPRYAPRRFSQCKSVLMCLDVIADVWIGCLTAWVYFMYLSVIMTASSPPPPHTHTHTHFFSFLFMYMSGCCYGLCLELFSQCMSALLCVWVYFSVCGWYCVCLGRFLQCKSVYSCIRVLLCMCVWTNFPTYDCVLCISVCIMYLGVYSDLCVTVTSWSGFLMYECIYMSGYCYVWPGRFCQCMSAQ